MKWANEKLNDMEDNGLFHEEYLEMKLKKGDESEKPQKNPVNTHPTYHSSAAEI